MKKIFSSAIVCLMTLATISCGKKAEPANTHRNNPALKTFISLLLSGRTAQPKP